MDIAKLAELVADTLEMASASIDFVDHSDFDVTVRADGKVFRLTIADITEAA